MATHPLHELLHGNLLLLWPLDTFETLTELVKETNEHHVTVNGDPDTGNIFIESCLANGSTAVLGTFPPRYAHPLTIIMQKWGYFFMLHNCLLSSNPRSAQNIERKRDLLDDWMRQIIYIDRVPDTSLGWANNPLREEPCRTIVLFLTQELLNTNHVSSRTSAYDDSIYGTAVLKHSESALLTVVARSISHQRSTRRLETSRQRHSLLVRSQIHPERYQNACQIRHGPYSTQ